MKKKKAPLNFGGILVNDDEKVCLICYSDE